MSHVISMNQMTTQPSETLAQQRIHNISWRRLPSMRSGVTIIWIEDSELSSLWSKSIEQMITGITIRIVHFAYLLRCIRYLKKARSYERVIIVSIVNNMSDVKKEAPIAADDLCRLCNYRQIQGILAVSHDMFSTYGNSLNRILTNDGSNLRQVLEVFPDYSSMSVRLQQLIDNIQEHDNEIFTPFNQRVQSLRDVRQQLGGFVWNCSFKIILMAMDHRSSRAKQEMISELRAHCRRNKQELTMIEKFKRSYCPADVIRWYTKPCFLHHLVNSALRTGDPLDQYTFRYFIVDMCGRLEEAAVDTRLRFSTPFRVYRGAHICRNEIEKYQIGTLLATNGFFSSSQHLDVAQQFVGIDTVTGMSPCRNREDIRQCVLFEIDVDLTKFPDTIVADVSDQSTIPDENEMIFDIGTTFIITQIFYDTKHFLWHIRMALSSEVAQLHRDYTNYIRKRLTEINAVLLFGNILTDMLSEHNGALTYFHRLLRTGEADDENRPNIYFHLARVYRYITKYQQAITYYRCAQLLQRRRLPQSNFDYARTLSGLGVIYLEMGNTTRAINLLKQGLIVKLRVLPEDHLENAHIWNRLAEAYWLEKQHESALVLLMKSLSFFKRKMPTNHPAEAQSLHILGLVQHALGNREQALQSFQRALHIRGTLMASDAPIVGETCYELSVVHAEQENEYPVALSYAQRALHIFQTKLSPKDIKLQRVVQLIDRLSQKKQLN